MADNITILNSTATTQTMRTTETGGIHFPHHIVESGSISVSNFPVTQPISIASVTIGNTVTIAGSVTASISNFPATQTTTFGSITGSVSVLNFPASQAVTFTAVSISNFPASQSTTFGAITGSISVLNFPATQAISIASVTIGNSVTIGSLPAISGTVTANSSNGSLTTRFGSVTTANTAFATSAVTNANRKYLLIQNVTTASNVITVGVGFTPTTTQGIQLTAGAGLTFEGNYIPTGAVNLLSSVTASCFTILEA